MTINEIIWEICFDNSPPELIELPFKSKGKNNMKQAEQELEIYMENCYPGKNYSVLYWDWIDPDNIQVECKKCGTWYGSVWNKKGGCPVCQENVRREKRKQDRIMWEQKERQRNKDKKILWWKTRKDLR